MADVSLATPTLNVTLEDGRSLRVQVVNADYVRWDRTAAKHNWPGVAKAPFLWMTFLAWSALRRTGQIDQATTWEDFSDRLCLQVQSEGTPASGDMARAVLGDLADVVSLDGTAEVDAPVEAGPTPEAPGPG